MYLTAVVQSILPQLHLQVTGCSVEVAAEGCGLQLLLHLLLQLISAHLQVPAGLKGLFLVIELDVNEQITEKCGNHI